MRIIQPRTLTSFVQLWTPWMKILILGQQTICVHNKLWIYQFHYMPFGWSKLQIGFVRGGGAIICAQGSNLKVDNIYPHTQWITLCIMLFVNFSIIICLFIDSHVFCLSCWDLMDHGLDIHIEQKFHWSSSWHLDKIGWDMEFLKILVATCMLSE